MCDYLKLSANPQFGHDSINFCSYETNRTFVDGFIENSKNDDHKLVIVTKLFFDNQEVIRSASGMKWHSIARLQSFQVKLFSRPSCFCIHPCTLP